jgi:hypothetical protein
MTWVAAVGAAVDVIGAAVLGGGLYVGGRAVWLSVRRGVRS